MPANECPAYLPASRQMGVGIILGERWYAAFFCRATDTLNCHTQAGLEGI